MITFYLMILEMVIQQYTHGILLILLNDKKIFASYYSKTDEKVLMEN